MKTDLPFEWEDEKHDLPKPMKTFDKIPVVGVRFRSQEEQKRLADISYFEDNAVEFRREPENKYDKNAIAVIVEGVHAGYVPSAMNVDFGEFLNAHPDLIANASITVVNNAPVVSVNISIP